ncbi:DgyrCDS9508 [Dimorphilus gyrociliatus]|uniref:Farnesyl pyrophosphate synthase n=1 Tax=Dimorphilus gyrociliatus TaxID=2664684 RepID=A0A7I8VXJ7_9ANNE|nr:DgyrCDS9508 [Dimorphilus gyrociliatus]
MSTPAPPPGKANSSSDVATKYFDEAYRMCVHYLETLHAEDEHMKIVLKRFRECNDYNVPGGKKTRGLTAVRSMASFKEVPPNDIEYRIAGVVGWCLEWLQASFLVHDDIMDNSVTRRGKTCWYKQEDVGLVAVNDGLYLQSAVYTILRQFCRGQTWFRDVIDLFLEIQSNTIHGQALDLESSCPKEPMEVRLSLGRYKTIAKYKTSYYSFVLPVRCGLYMAGISSDEIHDLATKILLEMGHIFQVQDDFLDCFGDPTVTGKVGTDIEDNKCTWLVAKVLQIDNENILQILKENYGKSGQENVARVKQLYNDLSMVSVYKTYEEEAFDELERIIKQQNILKKEPFLNLLKLIYKRER